MDQIFDRRQQARGKNLGNRQRFVQRARAQIRQAIRESLKDRRVADSDRGETVSIPRDEIHEPEFAQDRRAGQREHVLPGNREFIEGDHVERPSGGGGGGGRDGSPDGDGEDSFTFQLSRDEFLDIFFEDLELPEMVKAKVASERSARPQRAGYTTDGPPVRINLMQTMRKSVARRVALGRPGGVAVAALERERDALRTGAIIPADGISTESRLEEIEEALRRARDRRRRIPFIDPVDLRYNYFRAVPRPIAQAVMFCLMDVSASMDEHMKDLAKRFFMLLHLFLARRYERVEVVFIRHTQHAQEVDEQTFFHDRMTGGTVVSSALEEMLRVAGERFPLADWNLYLAQASDGDDWREDIPRCRDMMATRVLPMCQYAAYIEVGRDPSDPGGMMTRAESDLWRAYAEIDDDDRHFAMRRVDCPRDIYPVFRELFSRRGAGR